MSGNGVTYVVLVGFPSEGMSVKYAGNNHGRAITRASEEVVKLQETLRRINENRAEEADRLVEVLSDEVWLQEWVDGVRGRTRSFQITRSGTNTTSETSEQPAGGADHECG